MRIWDSLFGAEVAKATTGGEPSTAAAKISLPHKMLTALEQRIGPRYYVPVKLLTDIVLIALAAVWTWLVVLEPQPAAGNAALFVLVVLTIRLPLYALLGIWKYSWKHVSPQDALQLGFSAVLGGPLLVAALHFLPAPFPPQVRPEFVLLTEPAYYLLFLSTVRLLARLANQSHSGGHERGRVLIVGAGSTGHALAYMLEEAGAEYTVVGYLDDDPRKRGWRFRGRAILGTIEDAPRLARERDIEMIVIAIPSVAPARLREILRSLEPTGLPVRSVPPLADLVTRRAQLDDLRELSMEDLLGRESVKLEEPAIAQSLCGKAVLVTGGGGSIGRHLCKEVVRAGAARLLVLGRGENSVFEAILELEELEAECELIPVICCIKDRQSLERVFARFRPEVVFHSAAHKHVPLMEMYPAEAIKNNVIGTLNLVESAVQYGVEQLVLVSTDKAVNPVNIMGASKRVAELIVQAYAEKTGINMVSVRFGNVLGSRGSVVPIMTRQIRQRRPVTVTDPQMVRYFMTIPEAVQLILQAGANGGRGESYILKMGRPVRIMDLACDLIRLAGLTPHVDIPIKIIGPRPGEKLTEDLFTHLENDCVRVNEYFYVVPSNQIELEELLLHLEELRQAAENDDHERIIQLLHELIPDFAPEQAYAVAGSDYQELRTGTHG